jgi:polyisoprenoid-binding protein YceI
MSTTATKTTWTVDPTHSEVQFKIKHLVISTVTGSFKKFSGTASFENEGLSNPEIKFSIDPSSIDTNQEQRDGHLRTGDFFDAASFPEITFTSDSLTAIENNHYQLTGTLNMRGVSKQVTMQVEYGGTAKDGYGNVKMGFEVTGTIHRKDFGLNWNAALEAGGLTLGEDVRLIANIQLVKQIG